MLQRSREWFSGLNLAQKVLAVLLAGLLAVLFLFSLSYLFTVAILSLVSGGRADSPIEEGAAPSSSASASASAERTVPGNKLSITGARWKGEKAVVEGTWEGEVSSVHCDLLEGGTSGKATRWWDRSVGTQMDWSRRTFTQEFVAAEGSGESLDPEASYSVTCVGSFSSGWSTGAQTQVEGEPPS